MIDLRVNEARLWSRIQEMAKHGATSAGGCNRQALTDEDKAGRELFIKWCKAADLDVRIDGIGNIFARRAGRSATGAVLTGSHLDTQPSGGKYDGILGVLAGLEVCESLNDQDIETEFPVELVVWTNEEGCRFHTAMMGSAVWAGAMPLEAAYALCDSSGASVREELIRIDQLGIDSVLTSDIAAAFELHIEQGPVLEAEQLEVGVVIGVQHMSRHRIVITGKEAHAGPTPMTERLDPMRALADFLPRLYAMAEAHGPDARITFGFIEAAPGSNNTVPGMLTLTVDIRHPERDHYEAMVGEAYLIIGEACDTQGLPVLIEEFWKADGVSFDQECIAAVTGAVDLLEYAAKPMVSGAGHDACHVASVCPTSMIFIPCEGGLSHNEAESITQRQASIGANVLLHAMLKRATLVPSSKD